MLPREHEGARCPHVGQHAAAVEAARRADQRVRLVIVAALCVAALLTLLIVIWPEAPSQSNQPARMIKGPDNNEAPKRGDRGTGTAHNVAHPSPIQDTAAPINVTIPAKGDDHTTQLQSNLVGTRPVSDGRTYSIALISAAYDIPFGTKLFAQGKIVRSGYASGTRYGGAFAIVEDERQPDKTLVCANGSFPSFPHREGEVVQVAGEYMGVLPLLGNSPMPTFAECTMADATNDVVRPAPAELKRE